MKKWLICLSLIAALCQNSRAVEWLTDVPAAMQRAQAENKAILLDFTGSDWCGWCKRLKSEVFDQPEFAAYANANLLMVEVDFPRHKELSQEQKEANSRLASKYGIRGYPTIILLNSAGEKIGNAGYMPGGPAAFIAAIDKFSGMPHHAPVAVASQNSAAASDSPAAAPRKPPEFVPIPPATPTHYGELALKGISGAPGRRLVLINNQTLMTGESAKVKVHDAAIEVTVKEIRTDSAVIVVEGQTRELKLAVR